MNKTTDELMKSLENSSTYDEFYKKEMNELIFESTSAFLNKVIREKNLKKSDIIKGSNLDKTYVSIPHEIVHRHRTNCA